MMKPIALEVVQAQLDAYNRKDVDALLDTYAHDAELFTLHGGSIGSGREAMRPVFSTRFKEPDLFAQLASRVVVGNFVTDVELITRNFPEGLGTLEMLCIYEVFDGFIQRASFAVGKKTLRRRWSGTPDPIKRDSDIRQVIRHSRRVAFASANMTVFMTRTNDRDNWK